MGSTVFPAAGGGVTQKVQEFTSTGTFTAPSNVSAVEVFLVGGGGGGGSARYSAGQNYGGGGGGGEVIRSRIISVTGGTSYTVTVGAGGAGATGDAAGADGSDTSFGSLLTARGGGGGGSINSSWNIISARQKATAGGYPRNANTFAQCGGGAAPIQTGGGGTTPLGGTLIFANDFSAYSGSIVGGVVSNATDTRHIPGLGIDGFGGGGWGGNNNAGSTLNGSIFESSIHGGGGVVYDANGNAGTANKGGGGGGATQPNTSGTARNGGNGGSGYAVVIYWS